MRMGRFRVTPGIDVSSHDPTGIINVVAVETGTMILVLTHYVKTTDWSAVSFASTGYPRGRGSIPSTVEIGFLRPQAHDDRGPAGMSLWYIRRDQVVDSATAAKKEKRKAERRTLQNSIHPGFQHRFHSFQFKRSYNCFAIKCRIATEG